MLKDFGKIMLGIRYCTLTRQAWLLNNRIVVIMTLAGVSWSTDPRSPQSEAGSKHSCDMARDLPLRSKNVCVIGAGMAGLAASRELRREGHAVTVMEQRGDVGGQWLYDPRTDDADPLGAVAPVKVHNSMYASVRLLSPREAMGFSDFQFLPRRGRDARRYPGHGEVFCYLKDFCHAFGLMDAVRLNTSVVRVSMALPPPPPREGSGGGLDVRWNVRSVRVEPDSGKEVAVEEVFDAVVVANGHYSQPRLPSINGMEQWRRRQLHSHSYRVPEPFRDEVVVMVGCGDSGLDIALDLCGVAKEVHLTAKSVEAAMTPALSKMLANHADLHLNPQVDRLCEDGRVVFADGSCVVADTVIYCTGYSYSLIRKSTEIYEFVYKYTDLPRMEEWKRELIRSSVKNMIHDRETFRDRDDHSEILREGLQRWYGSAAVQEQEAAAADDDDDAAQLHMPLLAPSQL
ncbi:flavin-containing monooxygenase FMO GS-OX-like 8 [Phragmites australis]|uniref:flavin-containing monooxygenase FMO GS-OX-like 8 n=1 Tax=Phragmites australis TaxID=29695 RepID=UPI002D7974E3|nr:flavin-containing monooxygenase FMO GS-OX-like 8 [Phragmites australis]